MFAYSRVDSNFNLASRGIPKQVPVIFLIIQSLQQRLINIFPSIVNYLLLSLNPRQIHNHRRDTNGKTKKFYQVINSRHLLNSSAGFALKANSVRNWLKWKSLLSSLRHETMKKGILLITHFLIISVAQLDLIWVDCFMTETRFAGVFSSKCRREKCGKGQFRNGNSRR